MPDTWQIIRGLKRATREAEEIIAGMELRNQITKLEREALDAPPHEQSRLLEQLRLAQDNYDRNHVNKKAEPLRHRVWQAFKESEFTYGAYGIAVKFVLNVLTLALYMLGITGLVYLMSWLFG